MVRRKKIKYSLVLYNDDTNSFEEIIYLIQNIAGYDLTRAANIAHVAHRMGKYKFMSFHDKMSAHVTQIMFNKNGVKTEIEVTYE
jgi:ATP-dependent Clp protease adapter protein ClpS